MKAILLTDNGHFIEEELQLPALAANDVLVNIKAAAFNPIDYQMRNGATERKRMHSPVLGREFAGVVAATGNAVTAFKVGEEVFAASGSMGSNGAFAAAMIVPQEILVHKPASLSFETAAGVPVAALTALQSYERLQPALQDRIFISGAAGGVGLLLTRLLLQQGHQHIVVTAGNEDSRTQLLDAGIRPTAIINYHTPALKEQLIAANAGKPFDHAIDLVGGKMSELSASLLKVNGTYVDVTALTTADAREELFNHGTVILNISNYAYSLVGNLNYYGQQLRKISEWLEHGSLTASPVRVIGQLSPAAVEEGLTQLEQNLSRGRKLVMTVGA